MRANLDATRGAIATERVALALAPQLGKREAQQRVEAACKRALERGAPVRDALAADPEVAAVLDLARLDALLDPAGSLGAAAELVDRALARFRARER